MRRGGKHVKGKSKFKKTVNGKKVDTRYNHGEYDIRFSRIDDSEKWLVTVTHFTKGQVSWESVQVPGTEAARIVGEIAPNVFKSVAEENVYVLDKIKRLNKKFPRATFDRIFEGRMGWTDTRKKRVLRRLRDLEAVKRKGKDKYRLGEAGERILSEQLAIANEGKRLFETEAEKPKKSKAKKKGKK